MTEGGNLRKSGNQGLVIPECGLNSRWFSPCRDKDANGLSRVFSQRGGDGGGITIERLTHGQI
jgi:hypothetical protein